MIVSGPVVLTVATCVRATTRPDASIPIQLRTGTFSSSLKEALRAKKAGLAHERDLGHRFPEREVGAMPPFGGLYQMPTHVDETLAEAEEITFLARSRDEALRLSFADYQRLAQPQALSFTR